MRERAGRDAGPAARPAYGGLTAQHLRALDPLCLNTGPLLNAAPSGSRSSMLRKPAAEFRDHRQYASGDDIRYVDWKASARQEHIFIKQGEQQKAAVVYVLLDCSASMAWGEQPKSLASVTLANALAYLALANGDRLVVEPVSASSSLRSLGPLWGKGQAPALTAYFQALRFNGQVDIAQAMLRLSRRGLSSSGLVLVISDLLGVHNLTGALEALPAPAWRTVICHTLHPQEIAPELDGHLELHDIETSQRQRLTITPRALERYRERFNAWQAEIAARCAEKHAVYTLLPTGGTLETELLPRLRRAGVVRSL